MYAAIFIHIAEEFIILSRGSINAGMSATCIPPRGMRGNVLTINDTSFCRSLKSITLILDCEIVSSHS